MGTKASGAPVTGPSCAEDHRTTLKSHAAGLSIASNSMLIAFKLTVGMMSGSIAIISEALHSGSDLVAAVIAFWSVRRAAEPPIERHHYGHEKVENVAGSSRRAHLRRRRRHHLRGREKMISGP